MLHHRFANVIKVSLCKTNKWKLENMKNKPNNTYIAYVVTYMDWTPTLERNFCKACTLS